MRYASSTPDEAEPRLARSLVVSPAVLGMMCADPDLFPYLFWKKYLAATSRKIDTATAPTPPPSRSAMVVVLLEELETSCVSPLIDGDEGGGGEGPSTLATSRGSTSRMVMPRRALAVSGVAKLPRIASITEATVGALASRVMVVVMSTLAASTAMATASELTPAAVEHENCGSKHTSMASAKCKPLSWSSRSAQPRAEPLDGGWNVPCANVKCGEAGGNGSGDGDGGDGGTPVASCPTS